MAKTKPIMFSMFGSAEWLESFVDVGGYQIGKLKLHYFPDQECCLQIATNVKGQDVILLDSLQLPNSKTIPLIYFAETVKAMGANTVGLVAPYLAYMRQDKQFNPGEGISSQYFARLISNYYNWLVTADPHLHRYDSLSEVFSIPTKTVSAAAEISQWIKRNIKQPIIIGPDSESAQWIKQVAINSQTPFLVLHKDRLGDEKVKISVPELHKYQQHTPVIVDDIISSAHTMLETIHHIQANSSKKPICIGIHAVFAGNAFELLTNAIGDQVVTCNTIEHSTNQIDITKLLIAATNKA